LHNFIVVRAFQLWL